MKVKILIFCLVFFVGCAGLTKDYKAREVVMFPDYSGREVWQASVDSLVDRYHCIITLSDADVDLIQARQVLMDLVSDTVFKWTIQVLESREGVNLSVHLDRSVGYLSEGATENVEHFIKSVRERLESRVSSL